MSYVCSLWLLLGYMLLTQLIDCCVKSEPVIKSRLNTELSNVRFILSLNSKLVAFEFYIRIFVGIKFFVDFQTFDGAESIFLSLCRTWRRL